MITKKPNEVRSRVQPGARADWLAGILYVCLVGWYDERRDEEVA